MNNKVKQVETEQEAQVRNNYLNVKSQTTRKK